MVSDFRAAIVVIDDDGLLVESVTPLLSRHGYRVLAAATSREGLELIRDNAPQLALIDVALAGGGVLEKLRSRFPATGVAISSDRRRGKLAAELADGAGVEWLLKPFNGRELVARLDGHLRRRELEECNARLQADRDQLQARLDACQCDFRTILREKGEALRKAHFEIARTEKLAAMGFLAAGMAHDLRNPLNSISLFTQLMRQSVIDSDQQEYLAKIIREVEKIDSIIRTLLDVSRRTRQATANVRMDQVIDAALDNFAPQIEAGNIRLERRYGDELPRVKADPGELKQVFTNLFMNALDEMPGGGRLGVMIAVEGGMVVVRVEDSGGGIPDQVLPNIFEPFFTTKPCGIGMGLPVVKRITRMYGGSIAVERSTCDGTVLRLDFPAFAEAGQLKPEPQPPPIP